MARIALLVPLALLLVTPASGALFAPGGPVPLLQALDGIVPQEPSAVPAVNPITIGPGSRLAIEMDGGLYACTANFVWEAGGKLYLGAAGHCFLPADKVSTHGPDADFDASEVRVWACRTGCLFGGESGFVATGVLEPLGEVVYARQTLAGDDVGNDFGLVEIPPAALPFVRTTLPIWGGPESAAPARANGPVCVYGNGVLVAETLATKARAGHGLGTIGDEWDALITTNSGDSGAALVTCEATADGGIRGLRPVGVLTHGIGVPIVGVGVPALASGTTTERAIEMAREAGLDIALVIDG